MIETLLEPLRFGFMQQALGIGALIAAVGAVLSCFLVLRGWSLMGDAISHAVLPGVVLAYIAGIPLAIGAFVSGLFCAVATGWVKANSRIKEDTVMGVVFTGFWPNCSSAALRESNRRAGQGRPAPTRSISPGSCDWRSTGFPACRPFPSN
jgi:hypothetical protein